MSAKRRLVIYSRAKRRLLEDDKNSIKRRRVEDVDIYNDHKERTSKKTSIASGPLSKCPSTEPPIFSDDNDCVLTPPSSPPPVPAGQLLDDSDTPRSRVSTSKPNAMSSPRLKPMATKEPEKKPLVQMQLNLGQSFQKKCRTCGMEIVPSSPEDVALHRKYHVQNVDGISITKAFLNKAQSWRGIEWHGNDGKDRVVSISRRLGCRSGRQYVMPVLNVAQGELGAVDIPYDLLWSLCYTRLPPSGSTGARDIEIHGETSKGPCYERYKVYLYIRGSKCVGLCLAERINKAYQVLAPVRLTSDTAMAKTDKDEEKGVEWGEKHNSPPNENAPVKITETADDAWMGISRIWVSSGFRKERIASTLLDCASKTFRRNVVTPKELIAFSQPTQSGARLAKRWFGRESGWHVYTDDRVIMESDKGTWYSRKEDEELQP